VKDQSSGGYEFAVLLAFAFRGMVGELHRRLAAQGFDDVRPAHGFAFARLTPSGATGNELAAHLGVSKQAAGQMIDYLEQHDYVIRKPHPSDGRGKIVLLTERGWDCIRATEEVFSDIERRWTDLVGPERMAQVRSDLRRFVYALGDGEVPSRLRPVW